MDERLRELERAAQTGDVAAKARWHLERVRQGELPRERLLLAAYVGSLEARRAVGEDAVLVPDFVSVYRELEAALGQRRATARAPREWLRRWCQGLSSFGLEPLVRAALAAAERVAEHGRIGRDDPGALPLDAVRAWLRSPPDERNVDACVTAADAVSLAAAADYPPQGRDACYYARSSAACAAYAAGSILLDAGIDSTARALEYASNAWALVHSGAIEAYGAEPPTLRRAIAEPVHAAIGSWALGESG